MQTSCERLEGDRVRLTVEVPVHDVDHAFEHALRDLAKSAKIPGFRAGKVPPGVIRVRLGRDAIVAEALDGHLSGWYGRALDLERLEPVDRPTLDYAEPPVEGEAWTFTAEVAVAPAAQLPDPLVLEAERFEPTVPDEAIDGRLDAMRSMAAQVEPVEGATAATGLLALIDFSASVGGKRVKEASAKDYLVELGSGNLLDGLEEAIVGMTPGETREATTTLPESAEPRWRGKEAVFSITLKELKRRVLPELDDAFAKEVSEFDTLAELRADIEGKLRERMDENVAGAFRGAVLGALGRAAIVDVPPMMIERRVRERLEGVARGFARRGMRFEQYLAATGQSLEDVVRDLTPEAEASARQELALRALADRLGTVPGDEELATFVREQAVEEGEKDPDATTRKVMESSAARETLREELRLKLALDHAVSIATPVAPAAPPSVEDAPVPADAKPEIWLPGDPR